MARDPMDYLLRLRRAAEDEAKRAFAAGLAEEAAARARVARAEAQISREGEIATDPSLGDGAVEAYVAWLPTGRRQAANAHAAHERATANVTLARAALTVAHAAAEAAAIFINNRIQEAAVVAARKSQSAMDEVAARPAPDEAG